MTRPSVNETSLKKSKQTQLVQKVLWETFRDAGLSDAPGKAWALIFASSPRWDRHEEGKRLVAALTAEECAAMSGILRALAPSEHTDMVLVLLPLLARPTP